MTTAQAKSVLITVRSRQPDLSDGEVAEAWRQMEADPELRDWFEAQRKFHSVVRDSLQSLPVPDGLRERILANRKIIQLPWWRKQGGWFAAAAAVAAVVVFAAIVLNSHQRPAIDDSVATYRARMVRTVMRQYRMDIVTNDMVEVRRFLASNRAPAEYKLPPSLSHTPVSGAGVLSWQDRRVSMVCFDGGKDGTLFLFIADAEAVKRASIGGPEFARVNALTTVTWNEGNKVYLLATSLTEDALRRYL